MIDFQLKNLLVKFKYRLFYFVFTLLIVPCKAQDIKHIDPPNWFSGMENPILNVLINGNNLNLYQIEQVKFKNKKQLLSSSVVGSSNQYLILNFNIDSDFQDTAIFLNFKYKKGKKYITKELVYPIYKKQNKNVNGINSGDFIYLIMPDRFCNANPKNDIVIGMNQSKIHRDSMFQRHGGDIQGIVSKLDYLKELGVTAIWPTPILENNQPKESYHGYAFTNHYSTDPRLGTITDYQLLKKEAEKRGIKLIQDVVYNHIGNEHYLFKNKPSEDWFNVWDTFTRTTYKASTLTDPYVSNRDKKVYNNGWFDKHMPDLNQNNPLVANYLIQNTIWWIETAKLNGLRIDTYAYPDQDFMNQLLKSIYLEYSTIGIFGETWVQGMATQAFFVKNKLSKDYRSELKGVTDFQLYYAINHALTNNFGWTEGLARIYHTLAEDYVYDHAMNNVVFLDNHDLSRFYSMVNEDIKNYKMGIGLLFTTRGTPQMYYGTEILMKNFSNPDGKVREDFPGGWQGDAINKFESKNLNQTELEAFLFTKTLANFRKNSNALKFGKMMQFVPEKGIYVYFRYDDNEIIMIILNQNKESVKMPTHRYNEILNKNANFENVITQEKGQIQDTLQLEAQSITILNIK